MTLRIRFKINGEEKEVEIREDMTLLELIRDVLHLHGTKSGCEMGECGACTVLLNGKPVPSCITLAVKADGAEITTIEGISNHPLIDAMVKEGAVQCGFCSPGMIVNLASFLDESADPSREEVREALSGNLCRCTGYQKIVDAVMAVKGGRKE
ncbi:MAG: (2Fe-2S)-binding protein [Synergistetes bacterium]|nr:(2Fe-2S)-binding protein [Synergistota bacterium]